MHVDYESLADGRRHTVAGDTQIGAHVRSLNVRDQQCLPIVRSGCCNIKSFSVNSGRLETH